jgi:hypothetical protein
MNPRNNVNNTPDCPRTDVYTLKHKALLDIHDAFVRKAVAELNAFDNLYFEICNEPYFGGVTEEWQGHIAQVIADAEKNLPNKHLIAQNIANAGKKIDKPNPLVSIFNFHSQHRRRELPPQQGHRRRRNRLPRQGRCLLPNRSLGLSHRRRRHLQ